MKKYALLFAFAMAFCLTMQAQITITQSDMPNLDSSYVRATALNTEGLDFAATGEDITWDFTSLEALNTDQLNYVPVSDAPFSYQFLFNNPFDQDHLADHAIQTDGIDFEALEGISFDEFYQFFQTREDAYSIVGYGATISGIPVPSQTDPIDVVYELPMEFQDEFNNYSEWEINVPTILTYKQKQTRSYVVDGYGTLLLPSEQSYEVLRVRMEIDAMDSIAIPTLMIDFEFPRNQVDYQWIAKDNGTPVLQATEFLGQIGTVTYKSLDTPDHIAEANKIAVNIYPNPATDRLAVQSSLQSGTLEIYDQAGRKVLQEAKVGALHFLDVSMLDSGYYYLVLQSDNDREVVSWIKE